MKTCCVCGHTKCLTKFGNRKQAKDGKNSQCVDCTRAACRAHYSRNRQALIDRSAAHYTANKGRVLEAQAEYRKKNRAAVNARANARAKDPEFRAKRTAYEKEYRSDPANRGRYLENIRAWSKRNRPKLTAYLQLRRAAERRALVPQDMDLLKLAAQEALHLAQLRERVFGFKWELDHVVPIRGKKVWGLHVPANFQVIPMAANRRKSNKFEVAT